MSLYNYTSTHFNVIVLLQRDVDPVVSAIRRGDVKTIKDLATSAPHSLLRESKDGWIPLHDAALCIQTECLKILLKGRTLKASFLLAL